MCTLDGLNTETNSEYGSPITSLSLNSSMPGCANHFTPDCFPNEEQLKAGFVKKLQKKQQLKVGSLPQKREAGEQ